MKRLKSIMAIFPAVLLFLLLQLKLGQLPQIGSLLNPFAGYLQNHNEKDRLPETLKLNGLKKEVRILFDRRQVPHIFAQTSSDLYFAQGFVTAKYRLWQMEIQTHAAAGRLSEILGSSSISSDRFFRRLGMVYGAKKALEAIKKDKECYDAVMAYTAGVNAFIDGVKTRDLPVEYKLLNYKPEAWKPLKVALLLKYMAFDLTGSSNELQMTRALRSLGKRETDRIYPLVPPVLEPIVPVGTPFSAPEHPAPPPPDIPWLLSNGKNHAAIPKINNKLSSGEPRPGDGTYSRPGRVEASNNWAVSGSLTASGYPILCNDPHLGLSLPSIWFEIQLTSPEVNVYGVSLPGSPGVIIGFNQDVAWGLTNCGSDAMDWYKIKFKDSGLQEYWHDNAWKKSTAHVEEILIRDQKTVRDTVIYTHHGPVFSSFYPELESGWIPENASLRWMAHEPSNELKTFLLLNRARHNADYEEALTHFICPAQNFVFADASGNIAIWHNGQFPVRGPEQGRYISDGSKSDAEWKEWIPRHQLPHTQNPKRGIVSSANQIPADSRYPYYLGWNYSPYMRGKRINDRLSAIKAIEPRHMIELQNDVYDLKTRDILPVLLEYLKRDDLSRTEQKLLDQLEKWDFSYKSNLRAPTLFDLWWMILYRSIWEDDIRQNENPLIWPNWDLAIDLIQYHPDSPYMDNRNTQKRETLADLVQPAFHNAVDSLQNLFGPPGSGWNWGNYRGTNIMHLAQIPAFSRMDLKTPGTGTTVNAIQKDWGPSWRMVVSLGPEVKAWGIFPGGQSGSPGSSFYDNMVLDWISGHIYPLHYLRSAEKPGQDWIVSELEPSG